MFPIVAELTALVFTWKFADEALAGTVMELGTVAAGLALDSVTSAPLAGALPVSVTAAVGDWPPVTVAGVTVSEFKVAAPTGDGLYPSWMTSKSLAVRLLKAGLSMSL